MNDGSAPPIRFVNLLIFVAKPDMIKFRLTLCFAATMSFCSDSLRKLLFHRKIIEQEIGIKLSGLPSFMFLFIVLYQNVWCEPDRIFVYAGHSPLNQESC
jgi:hypothetical protein